MINPEASDSWGEYGSGATHPFTVPGSLLNSILIAYLSMESYSGTTETFNTPTYNGVNLTKLDNAQYSSGADIDVWYLVNPPAGVHNFIWSKAGGNRNGATACEVYSGVDQANPFKSSPNKIKSTGDVTAATISLTLTGVTANNWVVDALGGYSSPTTPDPTAGAGQTVRITNHNSVAAIRSSDKSGGSGSVTMTQATGVGVRKQFGYIVFELVAASGAHIIALPQVSETDVAQSMSHVFWSPWLPPGGIPPAFEDDTAQPLTGRKTKLLPMVSETGLAQALTLKRSDGILPMVFETDTVREFTSVQSGGLLSLALAVYGLLGPFGGEAK